MVDFLRNLFFESLVLLVIAEGIALAVVLAIRRRQTPPAGRWWMPIALVVCAALLAVQWLVRTDRERLRAAVTEMALAVDDGDVAALAEHIDADFQYRDQDRRAWLDDVRQRLQRWRIDEARVGGFVIAVEGDNAVVSFRATCDWRSGDQSQHGVHSLWKLSFVRRERNWRLLRVLDAKIGPGGLDYTAILRF
ncbi:MAG: hypothetical protein HY718_10040 [Planctomycetes bacterium]|nr:hypothetical protein [Planctomycetota bacterium]